MRNPMSDDNSEHENTTKAVVYIWRVIANLSAGSIIALLFSFFVGYQYEQKYLSRLGAQWAFDLLSFNEIVLESFPILLPLLIGIFIALNYLYNYENGLRTVIRRERWIVGIAIILYVIGLTLDHFYPEKHLFVSLLLNVSMYVIAFASGFVIVEIIGDFRDKELKIDDYIFRTLIHFLTTIFLVVPSISAVNAEYDLTHYKEKLVKTCILNESCKEHWYIVRPINDKFLVLSFGKDRQKNFRLVPISDVIIKP